MPIFARKFDTVNGYQEIPLASNDLDGLAAGTFSPFSDVFDVTANEPSTDVLVAGHFATAAGVIADLEAVFMWVVTLNDGINYTSETENYVLLGKAVHINTAETVTYSPQFSIVQALGYLPEEFKIVIENRTGLALSSTAGENEVHALVTFVNSS